MDVAPGSQLGYKRCSHLLFGARTHRAPADPRNWSDDHPAAGESAQHHDDNPPPPAGGHGHAHAGRGGEDTSGEDETLIAIIDGKPLAVGGASGDREARCGRGAGMFAKGYKLFTVWGGLPAPEVFRVDPMNKSEDKVAVEMMCELDGGRLHAGRRRV